jgi:microsomal dipeptidase-like Zn-dependent dipeptidase
MASHSNSRSLAPVMRNLTDSQTRGSQSGEASRA